MVILKPGSDERVEHEWIQDLTCMKCGCEFRPEPNDAPQIRELNLGYWTVACPHCGASVSIKKA